MFYPKELFSIREDVTRRNIEIYEKEQEEKSIKRYNAVKEYEKQIGRRLNLRERLEFYKQNNLE